MCLNKKYSSILQSYRKVFCFKDNIYYNHQVFSQLHAFLNCPYLIDNV